MALRKDSVEVLRRILELIGASGRLMTFGRVTVMWDDAPTPEEFFKSFGFSEVHSLDVSDYQGCTHVHDLNSSELDSALIAKYQVVMPAGTLEHVFCTYNALRTAARLL